MLRLVRGVPARGARGLPEQRAGDVRCLRYDLLITLYDALAELRQRGAAARLAAGPSLDQRASERVIEIGDQKPRAAIRHLHGARGPRDRFVLADLAQEIDLAGTE